MESIAPLISTRATGPLGINHLPRLWQKLLLHQAGVLPDGYRHGEGGFDQALCEKFGVDRPALIAYVEADRPGYLAFEHWFETNAKNLSARNVAEWNTHTATRNLTDEMAIERRKQLGITNDAIANAVLLNELDDWQHFHDTLTAK